MQNVYSAPRLTALGSIATTTLASLCVVKKAGGSDNALDPNQQPGPGTQVGPVFEC